MMTRRLPFAMGLSLVLAANAFGQPVNPATGPTGAMPPQPPGQSVPNQPAPSQSPASQATPSQSPSASSAAAPVNLSAADRSFLVKATAGGLTEVEESQIAQDKAKDEEVKTFAQHVVSDHSAADDKLKSIADAAGVQPPANPDTAQQKQIAALRKLQGNAFDRRYVHDQVAAHKATLALFEKEARSGSDPQLKQFASDTVPTIRQHLTDAEGLVVSRNVR